MKNEIKQRDFERLAAYRDSLYQNPRLTYLFFELTDACNLSCLHCGSCAGPQNHTYLPADAIKKVLQQTAKAYAPENIMICLTGGEPLMHPDFFEIAAYAVNLGFSCGITTNATLITGEVAQKMVDCGICSVGISLDGSKPAHDWFRNKDGAFEKCIAGIQNLVHVAGKKITTQITSVIHQKNFHELEAIYELACDLKVNSWRPINLEPIGRALHFPELLLSSDRLQELLTFIQKKRFSEDAKIHITYGCSHYLPEEFEHMVRDYYFICGSGIYVASILCNGDIYSCLDIERRPELVQGNISTDDFIEVWEHGFQEFRKDRTLECKQCLECADRKYCRGDSAHTWDYENHRPLLCMKQQLNVLESQK